MVNDINPPMQIKFYLPTLSLLFFIACTPSIEKEATSSSEPEVNSTPENHELDTLYLGRTIKDKSGLRTRRSLPLVDIKNLKALDIREVQVMILNAKPGDTILLKEGIYHLNNELIISESSDLTLQGMGMGKTILNFVNQKAGGQGLNLNKANNITLCDFSVYDAHGDGIKTKGCNNMAMQRIEVLWTKGPKATNGGYGLYPVESKNILIEQCLVSGASDAGIYVGQSTDVIVRKCYVYHNVAGIEIENCTRSLVYDNVAEDNTGGILVFNLPDLPVNPDGAYCKVYDNVVVHNNYRNFAPEGNMVAIVAPGSGIVLLAAKHCLVYNNEIRDNKTMGVAVSSYFVHNPNEEKTESYDPYSSNIFLSNNAYSCDPKLYADNSTEFGLVVLFKGDNGKGLDILSDGVFAKDEDMTICIDEDLQSISFGMLDGGDIEKDMIKDAKPYADCEEVTFTDFEIIEM